MMVPSISPFPVLLKRFGACCLLIFRAAHFELLSTGSSKKKQLAVFTRFFFFFFLQVHISFFHTVLLPKVICCEF